MAIKTQRFQSLNTDTQIASTNLQKANNNGTLNKAVPTTVSNPASAKTATGGSLTNNIKNKLSPLPGQLGKAVDGNQALELMTASLSSKKGLPAILQNKTKSDVYDSTLKYYNNAGGGGHPSKIRNKLNSGTFSGGYYADACLGDLSSILDMINGLGGNLGDLVDQNAIIALLLALLEKILCAGVNDGFESLLTTISNPSDKEKFGARSMEMASISGNSNLANSIATSSVGPSIANRNPGVSELALSSTKNYNSNTTKQMDKLFLEYTNNLQTLDSNWNNSAGTSAGVHAGSGNKLGDMGADYLKGTGDTDPVKLNTSIGLMNANQDPMASVMSPK